MLMPCDSSRDPLRRSQRRRREPWQDKVGDSRDVVRTSRLLRSS